MYRGRQAIKIASLEEFCATKSNNYKLCNLKVASCFYFQVF